MKIKLIIVILMTVICTSLDAHAGFLSFYNPINQIICSHGNVYKDGELIYDDAELNVAIFDDKIEITLSYDGGVQFSKQLPSKYTSVICDDEAEDENGIFTIYTLKYGSFGLGYVNYKNNQTFTLRLSATNFIDFIGTSTKFYNKSMDVIKKKNGQEIRDAGDIDIFFNGLFTVKNMGLW